MIRIKRVSETESISQRQPWFGHDGPRLCCPETDLGTRARHSGDLDPTAERIIKQMPNGDKAAVKTVLPSFTLVMYLNWGEDTQASKGVAVPNAGTTLRDPLGDLAAEHTAGRSSPGLPRAGRAEAMGWTERSAP